MKLTPKLYYDFVLQGPTYEFNASSAVPLTAYGTELDFTATVGTFSQKNVVNGAAPKAKNWGNYWLLGVAAPFTISRSAKLTVGFAYTAGSGNYMIPAFKFGAEEPGQTLSNSTAARPGHGTRPWTVRPWAKNNKSFGQPKQS